MSDEKDVPEDEEPMQTFTYKSASGAQTDELERRIIEDALNARANAPAGTDRLLSDLRLDENHTLALLRCVLDDQDTRLQGIGIYYCYHEW